VDTVEGHDPIDTWQAWLLAVGAPLAAAALMLPLRDHTQASNLALIMVVVVAASVMPGRRLAAVAAGISAGLWFDFFLTRPYERFSIQRGSDAQTTGLLVLVAIVVGEIAARRRRAHLEGDVARGEVVSVYVVAQMLSAGTQPDIVIAAVAEQLRELLFLSECRFDETSATGPYPVITRAGELEYGQISWPVEREGLPNREVALPVESDGHHVGDFILRGPPLGVPLSQDRRLVAVALADLTGAALRVPHLSSPG
jgi:hypothetical protein